MRNDTKSQHIPLIEFGIGSPVVVIPLTAFHCTTLVASLKAAGSRITQEIMIH